MPLTVDKAEISSSISNGEIDLINSDAQMVVVDPPHREP